MTTVPTSDGAPADAPVETPPRVAVAILRVHDGGLADVVEAVSRQVYEPASVAIVGPGPDGESGAWPLEPARVPDLETFVAGLGPETDLVWLLHSDARPLPDALGALVAELGRNDASMIGSKILDAERPDVLESVGAATDVYGEPYSGLDPDEVDLEQYDVVRDVAFVSGVSALLRRDLVKGLRGMDPKLAPVAAGMDLSMRARIAGGRVMVAPSSEVRHARACGHDVAGWREWAGRMRAMLKAYRFVTLAWVVPIGTLIGFVDGLVRLLLGQTRPIADFARAGAWNVANLPSSLATRSAIRPVRQTGDEELFRYQVGGSVRLRGLLTDLATRFGWFSEEDRAVLTEEEMESESTLVGPVVAGLVLLVVALGARHLWFGSVPAVGFSLPSADPLSVLSSYAGGWNPTQLGSPESIHPAAAALAAVQSALLGWSGAQVLLTMVAMVLGVVGTGRLLDRLGASGPLRHLGALALLFGPFALALARPAHWAGVVALGGTPWIATFVLTPWPSGLRLRLGRLGAFVLATALVVPFAPLALALPTMVGIAGALLLPGGRVGPILRGLAGSLIGAVLIGPYLVSVDPDRLLSGGPGVDPWRDLVPLGLIAGTAVLGSLVAPAPRWRVAAIGGVLVAAALGVAATPDLGGEAAVAGMLVGSLGAAMTVGAVVSVDTARSRPLVLLHGVAALAAVAVVAVALVPVPAGRAGMPSEVWNDRLDFVEALAPATGPGRVLVVGLAASMPGESRVGNGYRYRLLWGSRPTLDEAWLPEPRIGDEALASALTRIDAGAELRPGALLSEFAIRWVVVFDQASLADALTAQLDLVELPLDPDTIVFENLAARPRVEPMDGPAWVAGRVGGTGPATDTRLRLADNANPGWTPGWQQLDWANSLSAHTGEIDFEADALRFGLAWASLALLVGGLVLGLVGGIRR